MLPPSAFLAPALLLGAAAPLAAAAASKTVPRRVRVNVNGEERQRLLQQPNDECANAEAVSSLPYQSMGSTLNVLPDFAAASCDADADAAGVWYSYTPPSDNTILKASVDAGLGIRMYTGDDCDALVCNVVFKTGEVEFIGMAGVEYKLLVSSQTFGAGASFTLAVEDLTPTEAPTTAAPSPSPTTSYQSYDNDDDDTDTETDTPVPSPALGQSPSWRYQGNYRQSNETTIAPTAAGGSATTPDNDSPGDSSGDEETMSLDCKSSKSKSYSYKSKSAKAFAKTGKGSISMSHSAKSEKSSLSYGAKSEKSMSYGGGKGGKDSKCDGDPMGKSAKGSGKGGKGMHGKTGKEAYGEGANELNSLLRYGDLNGAGRWSVGTGVWAWTLGLAVWASCSR